MALVETNSTDFNLEDNFQSNWDHLCQIDHKKATEKEAEELRPLFGALAEYANASTEELLNSETVDPEVKDVFSANIGHTVCVEDIEKTFKSLAESNGSLVLSDMSITDIPSLLSFEEQGARSSNLTYRGQGNACFPGKHYLRQYKGWGFVQIEQDETPTRISLPVLGLSEKFKVNDALQGDGTTIKLMERIGRLCNHDWLHHLTMTYVIDNVVHSENNKDYGEMVRRCVSNIPAIENYPIEGYEALCVKTHSDLLNKTDAAKGLRSELEDSVAELSDNLNDVFANARKSTFGVESKYKAANYLALTTARILRRVEPLESDLTQSFLNAALNWSVRGNHLARSVRDKIWKTSSQKSGNLAEQATSELRRQYERSGMFTKIYEDNEFTRANRSLVAQLSGAMKLKFA